MMNLENVGGVRLEAEEGGKLLAHLQRILEQRRVRFLYTPFRLDRLSGSFGWTPPPVRLDGHPPVRLDGHSPVRLDGHPMVCSDLQRILQQRRVRFLCTPLRLDG